MTNGVILNLYPDSLGPTLGETVRFLERPELKDAFTGFYLLPSVFNTDLDHGFSVISYDLCEGLASAEDLARLKALGPELITDMILNHLSVLSPQFRDVLKNGDASPWRSFFIDWNRFWAGTGEMGKDGCVHPGPEYYHGLNLRADALPVLMARLPDGRDVPFWCSFYQQTLYPVPTALDLLDITGGQYRRAALLANQLAQGHREDDPPERWDYRGFEQYRDACIAWIRAHRRYLGQLDVDVRSDKVWAWYGEVMARLKAHGATVIRLDAFTRLHKAPGRVNFMNEPETWPILQRLIGLARDHGLGVLPEVHAPYTSMAHKKIADRGAVTYDYFLPALMLDALLTGDPAYLCRWANEQRDQGIRTINMLGCHDGIPVRDLRGLLPDERLDAVTEAVVKNGGLRKWIHGATPEVYQLNTTYYSALGADEKRMLTARAVQMFMPGTPQVWYEDLLAGENDLEALRRDPSLDEREINRRSYTPAQAEARLQSPVVLKQLSLLRMRCAHRAFREGAFRSAEQTGPHTLKLTWAADGALAVLEADVARAEYTVTLSD